MRRLQLTLTSHPVGRSATRGGPAKPHRAGSHNAAVLNFVKTLYLPSHQLFLIT